MSFWVGTGSVFNLGGSYYNFNSSESSIKADNKAILNDWFMIGKDFINVLGNEDFDKENLK